MIGWISIHRRVQDHWIFQDPVYFQWWIIVLLNVNRKGTKFPVNHKFYTCLPGSSFRSLDSWSGLFGCSKKTTVKFFKLLEDDQMITREVVGSGNRRKHMLTVVNWEKYQKTETENSTENSTERKPKTPPKLPSNNKENKNNIIYSDFDLFWNEYHNITGRAKEDKAPAQKHWHRLTKTEQSYAVKNIQSYFQSLTDPRYCKKARTYLADKSYNNEFRVNGRNTEPKPAYMENEL